MTDMYLVFNLVFSPIRMTEIQIMCLFILYKPQTVYIGVYMK